MPRPLALLVEATEPGALNLCRAFREAGHDVTVISRSGRAAAQDLEVARLSKATNIVDLYLGRQRDARAAYWLNSLGHKAARAGLGDPLGAGLLWAWDQRLAKPCQERLAGLVRDSGAEVVYGFWGIGSMPEQRALQRAKVPQALVHQFQTYPLGKALQAAPRPASPLERVILGRLDGRIHASPQMEQYLDAALRPVRGVDAVLPEAWGSWMRARERLPRLSERDGAPHVVHIGALPARPGHHDDVGAQLEAIAAQGIAVHAVEGFAAKGVKTFPRMGLRALMEGDLATFLTQFDALILPVNAPPGLQWFAGNFPARFLSALSAGVPVAVPRGIFGAVQAFVEREGSGLVYDSPAGLAAELRDPEVLHRAGKVARELQRTHTLDRFIPKYQAFLDRVLDLRAGKPGPSGTLK